MKKNVLYILSICTSLVFLTACDMSFVTDILSPEKPPSKPSADSTEYVSVTFDTQGGSAIEEQKVALGSYAMRVEAPKKNGYDFLGWYIGESEYNFRSKVSEDITLTAKWTPTEYSISYDLSGGSLSSLLVYKYTIESDTITLPKKMTKQYCTFAGWLSDGKPIEKIPKGSTGNLTLVADFYGPLASTPDSAGSSVRTYDNGGVVEVKLTSSDNTAKSVHLEFGKRPWQACKIVQGNEVKYVYATGDAGALTLDFDMIPNDNNAYITPVILTGKTELKTNYGKVYNGYKIDANFYPGFVRKAVTFTIDDGKIDTDTQFLNIVRPSGIIGTFNICNTNATDAASYLMLYQGYEVANHHQLHCLPWRDGFDFSTIEVKDEIFNSATADVAYMYKTKTEGLFYIDYKHFSPNTKSPYWHPIATNDTYKQYEVITREKIEAVFGKGSCVGFAYPHGHLNEEIKAYLEAQGYLYARRTGTLKASTNFALPLDRFAWTYNADSTCLIEVMELYEALSDDGNLKFFSFGVHSSDFNGKWDVLKEFADKYGSRPEDYYYATNRDIFEYEDAVKALQINETESGIEIINSSDIALFITVNNQKVIVQPNSTVNY